MTAQHPLAVEQGHTGKRVRYTYRGDTWDGWLVTLTPTPHGVQATVKRDDGQCWVVMSENCTPIDAPGPLLDVFVSGRPAPQGSKRHVGNGIMVESSKALPAWREAVRWSTAQAWNRQPPIDGPVHLTLEFVLPRPLSTPKRRTPPATKKPDASKLLRAVEDALTDAGVWRDDSLVVDLRVTKRIAEVDEAPGCRITIHTPVGDP